MSYRGRGGFSERRGRGGYRGGGGYNSRSTIVADRPRRSPEWKRNSSRDNYGRDGNWTDRNRDTRREEVRTTRRDTDFRDSRRSEFERERYDDRRDERNRNGNHFESDFRQKRKYSGERNQYQDTRSERGTNNYEHPSTEYPHKRQHFETRGRGFRGRGDLRSRRDELFRERRSFRDSQRAHSSSFDRSRNTSGHRSERGSDRRNISNYISNIRHETSPRAATDKSAHVATKEELQLESQVIDEKFYETMTLDQRDYIASKALRILVTKSEGQCKLSELEYELMDIKIMFVSSELFMEFLQSFMDDDNVFEIIEAEPEEEGDKCKENKDNEKSSKGSIQVKKEPEGKDGTDQDEEKSFTNIKDAENKDKVENTENQEEAENTKNHGEVEKTEHKDAENPQEPDNMDENNDQEEAEGDSKLENVIIVGRPKIMFCQKYVTNISSCSKNCGALHICKFYILSKCNAPDDRNCCFRHSLDSEHNQEALRLNLLHTFSIDHLKKALSHLKYRNPTTLPPICWFYNTKGCIKSQAGGCPFLHMCEKILEGEKCDKGKKCLLNHDILTNREVLTRFGMWSPEYSKDDLMKVISENYVAHESYAKKFPDSHHSYRDHKDDYYSRSGTQKPRWQLYVPSEEMWMDLTETCHRELESKHRAVVRAKDEYEEALEEMRQFKTSTLIGEKKEIAEVSNKIFRRLDQETETESKETNAKVKKDEEHEKEMEVNDDNNDNNDDNNDDNGKVKVKEEADN
ncbi:hypothetical protein LOTGIDRAFT_160143 [Lottia gigantea]|uniref:PARP12-like CCCH zinc finger tandem domain-containing protein n=1 Tax=Lottia gigantea TaxID=225164 RepID=V4AR39_LOTGI|nr:hypothetical protein LOTGIDRAFT_160143 [Lottia gigantea]ESO96156.1 hypothetical protein LOTGIDRAFT_160143 [Lottia gigantea]